MMLDDTGDEEHLYKLECLYEWWQQEEPLLIVIEQYHQMILYQ